LKFSDYDLRQAFLNVEDDGSIIMRDAWGSEIIMRGGNVIITCAGQIELRPGKSLVALAGDDIVAKARNSVDVMATNKDVRVKANTNLHLLSEGRADPTTNVKGGGILLESLSEDDGSAYEGKTGEEVISKGITLKAEESRVFCYGKKVHLGAPDMLILETFDDSGQTDNGDILVVGGRIITNSKNGGYYTNKDATASLLTNRTAVLAGQGAYLLGGGSVGVIRDSKAWVPFMEVGIGSSPYSEIQPALQQIHQILNQSDQWLAPYDTARRPEIQFTYRSTLEYGTKSATEIYGATKFYVYEGSWSYLARMKSELVDVETEAWEEFDIDDTWPWPGEEYYGRGGGGSGGYVELKEEVNIEDPKKGLPKERKSQKERLGTLEPKGFGEYKVIKE
jgi:hypothetical protein